MRRVDLLGVAGSGKSGLVRTVLSNNGAVAPKTAVRRAASSALISTRSQFSWNRWLFSRVPRLRTLFHGGVIPKEEATAFTRFAEQHDAFLATVHENFALSGRSQYRRAEGYYHFIRTVRRIAFLEEWLEDEAVLFDESLSQKVYAVIPWDRGNEAHARRYFEHMPLPTALIHLDADAVQVVRQVRERERATGKLIPGHRGLSDDELMATTDACLHFARIGAECLQARGCPVLPLTASEPTELNARRVTEFIQGVSS